MLFNEPPSLISKIELYPAGTFDIPMPLFGQMDMFEDWHKPTQQPITIVRSISRDMYEQIPGWDESFLKPGYIVANDLSLKSEQKTDVAGQLCTVTLDFSPDMSDDMVNMTLSELFAPHEAVIYFWGHPNRRRKYTDTGEAIDLPQLLARTDPDAYHCRTEQNGGQKNVSLTFINGQGLTTLCNHLLTHEVFDSYLSVQNR